jgi:hypothetical protein
MAPPTCLFPHNHPALLPSVGHGVTAFNGGGRDQPCASTCAGGEIRSVHGFVAGEGPPRDGLCARSRATASTGPSTVARSNCSSRIWQAMASSRVAAGRPMAAPRRAPPWHPAPPVRDGEPSPNHSSKEGHFPASRGESILIGADEIHIWTRRDHRQDCVRCEQVARVDDRGQLAVTTRQPGGDLLP